MEKIASILEMGGYGPYVWTSFLIAGLVMLAMTLISLRSLRRARMALAELQMSDSKGQKGEAYEL